MPMVFAIQNTPVAISLNLALQWLLYQFANGNITIVGDGFITKSYFITTSTSSLYYEYTSLYNLTTREGTWSLFWTLSSDNCTQFPTNASSSLPGHVQGNTVVFTTKNGTQTTDLVAAAADDVCASAESFAFNVTGLEEKSVGSGDSVTSCAVVASTSPSPNPCAAQLNATGASSISAALTTSVCSLPSSLVSCPKSAGSIKGQLGGPMWAVATFS